MGRPDDGEDDASADEKDDDHPESIPESRALELEMALAIGGNTYDESCIDARFCG